MKQLKRTRANFEKALNRQHGDRTGSRMRRNDPIQFDVLYNEWCR